MYEAKILNEIACLVKDGEVIKTFHWLSEAQERANELNEGIN
tara:strand:- start:870 stop:995 length:126 start_codon:yes stop_codon:yes gene_type:complete